MSKSRQRSRVRAPAARRPVSRSWNLKDEVIETALLTGQHAADLDALFGEAGRAELAGLARQASASRRRGGPKVLILPGIMGSKLGVRHNLLGIEYDDVYWLDPIDFALGIAKKLARDGSGEAAVESVGVFLSVYLKLKLSLIIAGYDAEFYPFDWRQNVKQLGQRLKTYIKGLNKPVSLVAHSMGGLVARVALKAGADVDVDRLVMLGTPNYGSFAPVQALRGVYATVQKLAALDLTADANALASIFGTFVGLCQMLPAQARYSALNFFDPAIWPRTGPAVRANVLRAADGLQDFLAAADERFFLIAGYGLPTVVAARLTSDQTEFEYQSSTDGDGVVPLPLARLENTRTYYVVESHGALPNNGAVIRAVKDILSERKTSALADLLPTRGAALVPVSERTLRETQPFEGRRGTQLRPQECREILSEVAAPLAPAAAPAPVAPASAAAAAPPAGQEPDRWHSLTVSRARQHRLEIRLVQGSITDVDSRAYVLGLFREVTPSGAAAALDQRLGGVITELAQRRMFGGNVGEVFILPANRRQLLTELIVFAGLGTYDAFNDDVQQFTAENVLRALIRTHVEDFATVLFGAGSGAGTAQVLQSLLKGFLRAKLDADADQQFRRLTLCELDPERYQEIRSELYRLASTPLFENIEVSFTEVRPRPMVTPVLEGPPEAAFRRAAAGPEPLYLLVRQESADSKTVGFRSSLLPPSSKAAILSDSVVVNESDLEKCLAQIENHLTFGSLAKFGNAWARLVLPDSICTVLPKYQDHHLVVVHDADSSRLPWETLHLDDWAPALGAGLSHRYLADNLSVAKYLEQRRQDETLEVLLIIDPTETLDGAKAEQERISKVLENNAKIRVDTIQGAQGTRQAILKAVSSGKYDVLHYAGHAEFNPQHRSQSGILCYQEEVLSGADLSRLANLPSLVFFNACESARVRGQRNTKEIDLAEQKKRNVGFAEAFLRGGVANFVGTYWPVGDEAAMDFGATFYQALLAGHPLGEAVLEARGKVHGGRFLDWADYIHYGDFQFCVKLPKG